MNNRHQKISFLRGLANGARKLDELQKEKVEIFMQTGVDEDSFYKGQKKDELFTHEQIEDYSKSNKKTKIVVLHHAKGCEPLSVDL